MPSTEYVKGSSVDSIAYQIWYWQDRLAEWEKELALWDGCVDMPGMANTIQMMMEEIRLRIFILRSLLPQ